MTTESDRGATTLKHVVDVLGPSVVRVLSTPGLDGVVPREVVIYDAGEPPDLRPGDVLLAVGVQPTSDEAVRLVHEAAAAGVAAFVVRTREHDLPKLRRAGGDGGVTVILLPAAMRWEQISVLMRNAIAVPSVFDGDTSTGDLFTFADGLATAVGGAVTIEDASSQVLAYSTIHEEDLDTPRREAILGRRVPEPYLDHLHAEGVFRSLDISEEVIEVPANDRLGLRRRLVVAVHANGELLGTIWAQEGRDHLDGHAAAALARAARRAPGHLLRAQSTGMTLRHRREDALREVLTGTADVSSAAATLGFDASLPCTVLGIELAHTRRIAREHHALRRLDELLRARAMAFRWLAAGVVTGGRLLVLVPELSGAPAEVEARVERLARELWRDAERAGLAVRVACGPLAPHLAKAAAATAAVDRILQLLAREPARGPVASHAMARAAVASGNALAALASVPEVTQGPVAVLLEHDDRHGTDYHQTLAAWLENLGDNGAVARALKIHPNTVRYRLQRIAEVSGMRLGDADERLIATLHLRLVASQRLRRGSPSAP